MKRTIFGVVSMILMGILEFTIVVILGSSIRQYVFSALISHGTTYTGDWNIINTMAGFGFISVIMAMIGIIFCGVTFFGSKKR